MTLTTTLIVICAAACPLTCLLLAMRFLKPESDAHTHAAGKKHA